MHLILIPVIAIIVFFGPQLWARNIMLRYHREIEEFPGTGGQLAEHLVKQLKLEGVNVERSERTADHYDPEARTIRLGEKIYDRKSLTAIVVTAHEVGHALQQTMGHRPFYLRWMIARYLRPIEKIAALILVAFPFVAVLTHLPLVGGLFLLAGIGMMFIPVLFHLITLPVEWDASFNRALPILIAGEYIPEAAVPAARRILLAAALTYLSASLASVLNFYRWIAILRR